MRTLHEWFEEYGESHQNDTNERIHYVCVPVIFFSIVGLLMSIPFPEIGSLSKSTLLNWAIPALFLVQVFYFKLSITMGLRMLGFSLLCLIGNHLIAQSFELWKISLVLFILAWIGQFYGHKIEGKKPSFLKDIQFLLIGPAWVINRVLNKKSIQ